MSVYGSGRYGRLALCVGAALALGCLGRSAEVRYFAMSPVQAPVHDGVPDDLAVAVTAVSLPRYLERPQMVTRGEGPELRFDEINRWAGGFEPNVQAVLVQNLGLRLGPAQVFESWNRIAPATFRVSVDVAQFDGRRGEELTLRARWVIRDEREKGRPWTAESTIRQTLGGRDIVSLVEAHDRALGELADEIAARIVALAGQQP